MTSSPAPDLDELERLRGALQQAIDLDTLTVGDFDRKYPRFENSHGAPWIDEWRALLEAPPAPSDHGALDVERLQEALARTGRCGHSSCPRDTSRHRDEAHDIASAYARLAAPSVPPEEGT